MFNILRGGVGVQQLVFRCNLKVFFLMRKALVKDCISVMLATTMECYVMQGVWRCAVDEFLQHSEVLLFLFP